MKEFFSTLLRNIIGCFKGQMILWHVSAIILTFILVTSGFDWFYFRSTRTPVLHSWMFPAAPIGGPLAIILPPVLHSWMFPAAPIGGLVPIILPLVLLAIGRITRSAKVSLAGRAVVHAELIGALVAAAYKAITGRAHPDRKSVV